MKLLDSATYAFLFKRVSPATLGLLRIAYGILMLWEFFHVENYMMGLFTNSKFFITYDYFHWIKHLAPESLALGFILAKIAAVMLIFGLFHRLSALVVFLFWTYLFLADRGHYTNHYYLFCLLGFWVWITNGNRFLSVDQFIYKKLAFTRSWILGSGDIHSIPYWQLLSFQVQIFVVYFYGGLAKITPDWLVGYPMRIWLPSKPWLPGFMQTDSVAIFMSWAGMLFDLGIGFLLMSRYRWWAVPFVLFFHVTNQIVFTTIGGFPHFMAAATFIYFPPDWPEKAKSWLGFSASSIVKKNIAPAASALKNRVVLAFLLCFWAWQFLYPFRHFLYPGDPSVTGEGALFGWRMMLTARDFAAKMKVVVRGETFYITGDSFFHYVNFRQFTRMCRSPKSFQKFAYFIQDEMRKSDPSLTPEIYGYLMISYNGRPYTQVIDTTVNLLSRPYQQVAHIDWVRTEPFEEPPGYRYQQSQQLGELEAEKKSTGGTSR